MGKRVALITGITGQDGSYYREYVTIDRHLFRPAEVDALQGDSSCARRVLGWTYSLAFEELVREMVDEDLKRQGIEPGRRPTTDRVI